MARQGVSGGMVFKLVILSAAKNPERYLLADVPMDSSLRSE
jgi:hypothetical protein